MAAAAGAATDLSALTGVHVSYLPPTPVTADVIAGLKVTE